MNKKKDHIKEYSKKTLDEGLKAVNGGVDYITVGASNYDIWIDITTGNFLKKPKKKGST